MLYFRFICDDISSPLSLERGQPTNSLCPGVDIGLSINIGNIEGYEPTQYCEWTKDVSIAWKVVDSLENSPKLEEA
jgi:hypothetical protein